MDKGMVQVICGEGIGKTSLAVGKGIGALIRQKTVIMIQFLKGNQEAEGLETLKQLEPDMKIFRFEKSSTFFENLSEEEKAEERMNIRNGLNFAKKVLMTGECDLLILDEVLGALDQKIITEEEVKTLLTTRDEEMDLILTGKVFPDDLKPYVDLISQISNVKVDNQR
ncbi:cob(I)yrinic acid a c-diamide adenosyltransferase [Clostridium sp. chh4-2]|uniref:cob(I)yrinic acid a,c-diamide adenosyltransferase n=1 Tax=Clostridium sp. chh4-2 TaxID=2067550 RepID=UPI000CCE2D02|nr:cob(I)yrinic acid a,c-diamide adenosyltransferase [Clostridium sp. chh4-2]PNV59246.1 cob(I)yrinic acid a c-diamide adenosyltransferase [Clostridium sp. chh4-2]